MFVINYYNTIKKVQTKSHVTTEALFLKKTWYKNQRLKCVQLYIKHNKNRIDLARLISLRNWTLSKPFRRFDWNAKSAYTWRCGLFLSNNKLFSVISFDPDLRARQHLVIGGVGDGRIIVLNTSLIKWNDCTV